MAIFVELIKCNCDNRVVNKTSFFTDTISFSENVYFRDAADLHNPVFTVEGNIGAGYNYCYINNADPDSGVTQHYYFARVTNIRTNLALVECKLDVLMEVRKDPSAVEIIPRRSSEVWNDWIFDPSQPVEVAKFNYLMNPDAGSWSAAVPNGEWDYGNASLIACIVGSDEPTNLEVVNTNE